MQNPRSEARPMLAGRVMTTCWIALATALGVSLAAVPWHAPVLRRVGLPDIPHPIGNPLADAKVALGRALFFDPVLSRDSTMACATCHDPEHGFADPRGFSRGVDGNVLNRDTPTVANLAFTRALFRDGRSGSLEEQALEPLLAKAEMASDPTVLVATLANNAEYRQLFEHAFGDGEVTLVRIARALATYERTLMVRDTAYDRWAAGDGTALSAAQQRGLALFEGKARCAECHPAPLFGSDDLDPVGTPDRASDGKLVRGSDPGLARWTAQAAHHGAFRSPSLRGVADTAPYMHNGVYRTLEEVIEFYDEGGGRGLGFEAPQDEVHRVRTVSSSDSRLGVW